MANRFYKEVLDAILNAEIDFNSDTLKLIGCSSGYTADTDFGGDEFLSDIAGGNRVTSGVTLTSPTLTDGAFDAANVTFPSVTGSQITQFVLYKDTGVEATSRLILLFDTGANIPATPNGGNIEFAPHATGLFALTP